MNPEPFVMMYVPVPTPEVGRELALKSVEASLTACANVHGPVLSIYRWEGDLCEEQEHVVIFKTTTAKKEALRNFLEEHHPYDCPCIADWQAEASPAFTEWIRKQIQ